MHKNDAKNINMRGIKKIEEVIDRLPVYLRKLHLFKWQSRNLLPPSIGSASNGRSEKKKMAKEQRMFRKNRRNSRRESMGGVRRD
ncbi:unnamed protein product [Nippostrongylus brasiliensis]|uniref:Uncharacterized protein n=1 Tax=Nippostrongylus brasiliensis TaxID=27835 RepID=A0A0N4XR65_NIPBR|nr:unnamed protein product [Nippostrongylus brasiliensis]